MKLAQDFFFVLQLTTSFSPIQMKSAGAKVNVLVRNMREATMTTTPVFLRYSQRNRLVTPAGYLKLLTKLSALIIRHCLFLEADKHSVRYFEEIVAVFQPAVRFIVNLKPVKNHKWFDGFNSNQRTKTGTKRVAKTIPYLLDSTCADYSSVCSVSLLGS